MNGSPAYPRRRDLGLAGWQIRYEQRAFWRNRTRGLFTFVFPLMFLVIFGSLFNGQHIAGRGGIAYDDFFVPGILAYGVIATTFINMAISTAILRDEGVLKRMQGTPLPRWAYVAGRIGSTVLVVAAMTVVTLGLGVVAYGVHIYASTLPAVIVVLVLGTVVFTSLGIGIVRFIPNSEAAPRDRQPDDPAADLHLRHLVRHRHDAPLAAGRRQDLPDPSARRPAPVRLRSAHLRVGLQERRPSDAGDLGRRRHRAHGPLPAPAPRRGRLRPRLTRSRRSAASA